MLEDSFFEGVDDLFVLELDGVVFFLVVDTVIDLSVSMPTVEV